MNFPILETKRLLLRAFVDSDLKSVFETYSTDLVTQYYDLNTMKNISEAKSVFESFKTRFHRKRGIRWAIELKETKQFIGDCGFNKYLENAHRNSEIGYALIPKFWSKGYATEAIQEIIRFGFIEKSLHRIEAYTEPQNSKSRKLLEKLGFKEEGILRENCYEKGRFVDSVIHGLLKSEFIEMVK